MTKLIHICEVCGRRELLEPEQAMTLGWDYPPGIGVFRVVSPRTCGDCPINQTLYWRILTHKGDAPYDATDDDMELITRISLEPESITPVEV